jgi:hypothetical protein
MRAELPRRDELAGLYAPDYFKHEVAAVDGYANYFADSVLHRATARRRLSLLARYIRPPGKLLDVGAAAGSFVSEASKAGWGAHGIDIATSAVSWGVEMLGADLAVGSLETIASHEQFSVVTMWDYIEHSLDPLGDLSVVRDHLRPGGVVAISTGDVESLASRLSKAKWHLLTPRHHNFFFGQSTLRRLLERAGYEVLWSGHPSASYSVSHLTFKLDRMVRRRVTSQLARRAAISKAGRIGIPVNLFDIVTVVARSGAPA